MSVYWTKASSSIGGWKRSSLHTFSNHVIILFWATMSWYDPVIVLIETGSRYMLDELWKRETASLKTFNIYIIYIDRTERVQQSFTRFLAYKDPICLYRAELQTRLSHLKLNSLEIRGKTCDMKTLHKILYGQMRCLDVIQRINISIPRSVPKHPTN